MTSHEKVIALVDKRIAMEIQFMQAAKVKLFIDAMDDVFEKAFSEESDEMLIRDKHL